MMNKYNGSALNEQKLRIQRSYSQKMVMLKADECGWCWKFIIQSSSHKNYDIEIGQSMKCTCQDFTSRQGKPCKHIYFIFTKLAKKSTIIKQLQGGSILKQQYFTELNHSLKEHLKFRLQGKREGEIMDVCQLCFDDFRGTSLCIDCEECNEQFHQSCWRMWAEYSPKCPVCNERLGFCTDAGRKEDKIYLLSLQRKEPIEWTIWLHEVGVFDRIIKIFDNRIQCSCGQFNREHILCRHIKFLVVRIVLKVQLLRHLIIPSTIQRRVIKILDTYLTQNMTSFFTKSLSINYSSSNGKFRTKQRSDNMGKCKICFQNLQYLTDKHNEGQHLSLCATSGDAFHEDCLEFWRKKHQTRLCPVCRKDVYSIVKNKGRGTQEDEEVLESLQETTQTKKDCKLKKVSQKNTIIESQEKDKHKDKQAHTKLTRQIQTQHQQNGSLKITQEDKKSSVNSTLGNLNQIPTNVGENIAKQPQVSISATVPQRINIEHQSLRLKEAKFNDSRLKAIFKKPSQPQVSCLQSMQEMDSNFSKISESNDAQFTDKPFENNKRIQDNPVQNPNEKRYNLQLVKIEVIDISDE